MVNRIACRLQPSDALTAVRFDDTGLGVAVGTSGGLVALFDLRAQKPSVVKDHMYGQRITDIKFHTAGEGGAGVHPVLKVPNSTHSVAFPGTQLLQCWAI